MAASEIVDEFGEDFLCCDICQERLKSPKVLSCLHVFCEKCLVTVGETEGSPECPECGQTRRSCIPESSVENIPERTVNGDSSPADLLTTTSESAGNPDVVPQPQVEAKAIKKPRVLWADATAGDDNGDGTRAEMLPGQSDGDYQVAMATGDQGIPGSPDTPVFEYTRLEKTFGSKGTAEGEYNKPTGVAINKSGDIVAADLLNRRIQVITREGTVRKSVRFACITQFAFTPIDLAISSDNAYFSLDGANNQVVVSGDNGRIIRCFGQNELVEPYGIAISPVNGDVYVTDLNLNVPRIRIYTRQGEYVRSFGARGAGDDRLMIPWGIAVGSDGIVYVLDTFHGQIKVFSADDQHLFSFGHSGPGQLKLPKGIAAEGDKYVYVSDRNRVQKFESRGGQFVCRIDSDGDGLNKPVGLALTDDAPCKVVVADSENHCIKVFVQPPAM